MELNKTYLLRVLIGGKLLTYKGLIVSIDDDGFIAFRDKFGKVVTVNKNTIQSYEEVAR